MLDTIVFMGICFSLIPGYEYGILLVQYFLLNYIVRVELDYHRFVTASHICAMLIYQMGIGSNLKLIWCYFSYLDGQKRLVHHDIYVPT